MSDENAKQKTERIGWLCATMIALGFFLFLTKSNACALACNSCNSHESAVPACKDEFFEIKNDGYASNHACTPGARVEIVASPPAPKPGIMCHCQTSPQGSADPAALPTPSK